mmetsp:Transcript_19537/g.47161  ORF Transcript_19537/g.47161 Transcript_19537/m.47161 type:complete len:371 (-) Transcript_19537:56-1168(-)
MNTATTHFLLILSSLCLFDVTNAFSSVINRHPTIQRSSDIHRLHSHDNSNDDDHRHLNVDQQQTGRRDFIKDTTVVASALMTGATVWSQQPRSVVAAETKEPFCVLGANGKTGTKVTQDILNRGIPVRATSRSGIYNEQDSVANSSLLLPMVCDVTDPSTIQSAIEGTRAVIFAASASKTGGTPAQVDNEGLVNVAKACIACNVPHLVIVSSGSVSKPDSPVFKFLNIFGRIMEEKIKGEDEVRALYASLPKDSQQQSSSSPTYTIIRPGGLTEEPPRGVTAMELNQGDLKTGRISRYDVASLCVESTLWPKLTGGTTYECYDYDTGKTLGAVGLSNILKQKADPSAEPTTGFERRGNTYSELFTGLQKD